MHRTHERMRKRVAQLVAQLDLPSPWDLIEFCARWDQQRGRTTQLVPIPARDGTPTGLTLSPEGGTTDYIWHVETTPLHRDLIVMHEIGHIVSGHAPQYRADPAVLARLIGSTLTHLSADAAHHMLGARTGFDTEEEQEAELFATMALVRAGHAPAQAHEPMSVLHATWGQG